MSDPRSLHQRRTHNLLLIQKLLSFRSETSPFTLVLDSVEQGAGGLIREIAKGAKVSQALLLKSFLVVHSFTLGMVLAFEGHSFPVGLS